MEFKKNHFHSVEGIRLGSEPVWFDLNVDSATPLSICIDLECGAHISERRALIQFEAEEPDVLSEKHGLVRSEHPGIGWYRYLCTAPGKARTQFELPPLRTFSGKIRMGIRTWWETDTIVLKSLMAVSATVPDVLAEGYASCRNIERYHAHAWSSLGEFLAAPIILGGLHTIALNNLLLDFCLVARRDAPLLCFLHGNAPRLGSYMLPSFSGWSVTSEIPASLLMFSDPSLLLDPKLQLAWHAGTKDVPLQYVYQLVIEKIQAALMPRRLVFWGGSGGGFASLYLSARFPGSTAFVWNPQTAILRYEEDVVIQYGLTCFGSANADALAEKLDGSVVGDVGDVYKDAQNTVIYLQNAGDWHTRDHLQPFLEKNGLSLPPDGYSGWLGNAIYVHLEDLSDGHNPPPRTVIASLLRHLASTDPKQLDIARLISEALPEPATETAE